MISHYLKTAFRFLRRNRLYTLINALGLSLSLAVSFIILLYVINELSYNHCHKRRKEVYRVVNYYREFKQSMSGTPFVLAKTMMEEFPQIERAINVRYLRGFKLKLEDEFIDVSRPLATSSGVFDIFTVSLEGRVLNEDPLEEQNALAISRKLADLFFPGMDPVGREIEALINNKEQVLVVTGVYEDLPVNSSLQADCFLNERWTLEPLNQTFGVSDMDVSWSWDFWNTWILISEDADASEIDEQFEAFEKKYISEEPHVHYSLQNLSDVYLKSADIANTGITGNIKNIYLFSSIAFLILLIAAINYIILSVAVSTGRAKEIGLRKTAGASKARIRVQVLSESVLLSLLVLPLALLFMELALPLAEKLFQASLEVIRANLIVYIAFYLTLTIFIGLASGIYASSYLSSLKVVDVLKQKMSFGRKRILFRSALIILQLVIFCSFVASTLIIRTQYQYAMSRDPGFRNHDILQIDLGRSFQSYHAFLNGIRSIPEVNSAAGAMDGLPMNGWMTFMQTHFQDEELKVKLEGFAVDYNFLETLGMTVLEGRTFASDFGSDLNGSVILNEKAVRDLGLEEPLGRLLEDSSVIIGVVKDFNLHSIHSEIPPLVIQLTDRYLYYILLHYQPGTLDDLLPKLEAEWKKVEADRPFSYSTIEDLFEGAYASEKNLGAILSMAALFALLIAAFGLLGLTLFIARSRTHELGIKKVFGSSEKAIVFSFLRSNFLMVLIAEALSIPVTIYFMKKWLNNFPFRTGIAWWVFLIAFLLAALVVMITVYVHALKASRINPVDALRYE